MTDSRLPGWSRDVLAILVLVAASAALFLPWFSEGTQFIGISPSSAPPWGGPADHGISDASASDALILTWPNLVHWMRSVREDWRGLLWNPRICCGTPFLGGQIAFPLYPTNLLGLAGGAGVFFLWTPLLHVVLANVGAYLALRRLALSRPACLLGAWTFGAGSWFLAHLAIVNFPQAAAWLPWILWAADRAQVLRRTRDRVVLAACVALSIFAGMIQITAISLLAAAIAACMRCARETRTGGPRVAARGLASAGFGVLLGVLVGGPQLLPLIEWSRDSSRVRAPVAEQEHLTYRPVEWVHLLIPDVFGSPTRISASTRPGTGESGAAALGPATESTYPAAAFAGVRARGQSFVESVCSPLAVGLVLVLCALGRPRGAAALFLVLAVAGALLAMDGPVMRAFAEIPGAASGNPRRFLLLCAAGLSGLASLGVDRIRTVPGRRLLAFLPAVLLLAWWLLNLAIPATVSNALAAAGVDPDQAARMPWVFRTQALPVFATLAAAALLAGFGKCGPWRLAALGLLAGADAWRFQMLHHPVRPAEPIFPETAFTRLLEEKARAKQPPAPGVPVAYEDAQLPPARVTRFRSAIADVPPPVPSNTGMLFSLRDEQGYGGILPRRLEEIVEAIEPGIVLDHEGIGAWRDPASLKRPCLRFMAVRQVIAADHEVPNTFAVKQFPDELASIFEIAGAQPRVTVLGRARMFEDDASLLHALVAPDFDPSQALLLAGDLAALGQGRPAAGDAIELPPLSEAESVRWRQQGAGEAAIESSLAGPRILVVAETWHPGWRAEDQAGRRLPVVRANHAFQALVLPEGQSRVRLFFWPASLTLGLCALALGALGALADMILHRKSAAKAL